jgi:DNA primase
VCEGVPDALIATQAGYRSVALLGAQTPDEAVAIRIAHHARHHRLEVAIVCDPDPAGRHVADVLAPLIAAHGLDPTIVATPAELDLNDWAITDPNWIAGLERALDTGITVDL